MSSTAADSEISGSRKRKKNVDKWKPNQKRIARQRGEAYISTSGKPVLHKTTGPDCT